jgi:hypothetical protein
VSARDRAIITKILRRLYPENQPEIVVTLHVTSNVQWSHIWIVASVLSLVVLGGILAAHC